MPVSRARRADTADRRAKLIKMRLAGESFDDCARALGYSSRSHASKDFSRALEENIAEQHASMEVYRETEIMRLDGELERLNRLYTKVEKILDKFHVTVQLGKIITVDGEPLEDDSVALAAVDRLVRIEDARRRNAERRAKLLGLDATQRVSMEVLTIDDIDAQVRSLTEQLAATDAEVAEAATAEDAQG